MMPLTSRRAGSVGLRPLPPLHPRRIVSGGMRVPHEVIRRATPLEESSAIVRVPAGLVATILLLVAGCSEDRPCPPPMLVCVATQEEAAEKNADLDPACQIYEVCDGGSDAGDAGD